MNLSKGFDAASPRMHTEDFNWKEPPEMWEGGDCEVTESDQQESHHHPFARRDSGLEMSSRRCCDVRGNHWNGGNGGRSYCYQWT